MNDHDFILDGFLREQRRAGMALAEASDILSLLPGPGDPPDRYIAVFQCKGLVRTGERIEVSGGPFAVGIHFPADYCRRVDPRAVIQWLDPHNAWNPHVFPPLVCLGRLVPGTSLVDILFQAFEVISYHKMKLDDSLNHDAAAWARTQDQFRFPIDTRPLKRRSLSIPVEISAPVEISSLVEGV